VINLMDALRKSIEAETPRKPAAGQSATRRQAARKRLISCRLSHCESSYRIENRRVVILGLITRVEIGHMRMPSAGKGCSNSRGSSSSLSQRS
jgi:hypothetical protein